MSEPTTKNTVGDYYCATVSEHDGPIPPSHLAYLLHERLRKAESAAQKEKD